MCGGGVGLFGALLGGGNRGPSGPTVDPEAERRKAEAEATAKANDQLMVDARRKRSQKGLLATDGQTGGSVLASGAPAPQSSPSSSTVLGSGGA